MPAAHRSGRHRATLRNPVCSVSQPLATAEVIGTIRKRDQFIQNGFFLFARYSEGCLRKAPAYGPEGPCTWIFSTDHQ